ncbi:MAG TPA: polyprenyl synthetase family protein [Tepidisphaeraceae bacterium]|nr:polyprenyl synthetase family protein [Tepidisphaeraceae bacterium]
MENTPTSAAARAANARAANAALASLTECIAPQLAQVTQRFREELDSDLPCVNALVKHVARFHGKMLRPMLVLLSGQAVAGAGGAASAGSGAAKVSDAHITLATVVEMVHMATLVHDDVLDEAELRRKGATINHLRGNEAAVLLGDYLISHSYHLCSSLQSQFASRTIARTTNQVCEGELLQIDNRNNLDLTEAVYLQIITRKTAVLCATCCLLGATFAGGTPQQVAALETYGRSLGIAFQIQDDILDIVGDAGTVGKTLGIDLEKQKMTLPVIHFLATAPPEHRALLRSLISSRDADKLERIRNLILPSDSIAYARARAGQLVDQARSALTTLPETEARRVLDTMADFVVNRPI